MDLYGDHTSTCTAHSGATKAHDWAVGVLDPLFRSAGHVVRSQHQVTANGAAKCRSDITYTTKRVPGALSSTCPSPMTASERRPTSNKMGHSRSRMHGEFLRILFLQAHRETTAHFPATGLSLQQNRSENAFQIKRVAFYMGLTSKVGLVAAKASALRINLNIQGCSVVAPSPHAPSLYMRVPPPLGGGGAQDLQCLGQRTATHN